MPPPPPNQPPNRPPAFPPPAPGDPQPPSYPQYPSQGGQYGHGGQYGQPGPSGYPRQFDRRDYAGFWQRFFHVLIDTLVNMLALVPGLILIFVALRDCRTVDSDLFGERSEVVCPADWNGKPLLILGIILVVVGAIAMLVVYCRMIGRGGQSIGMKSMGIRLVNADTHQVIGAGRAFGWQIAHAASGALFGLGYLWMLWDERRQTWHDKILNTVMVRA